jgi:hypothetical protein
MPLKGMPLKGMPLKGMPKSPRNGLYFVEKIIFCRGFNVIDQKPYLFFLCGI